MERSRSPWGGHERSEFEVATILARERAKSVVGQSLQDRSAPMIALCPQCPVSDGRTEECGLSRWAMSGGNDSSPLLIISSARNGSNAGRIHAERILAGACATRSPLTSRQSRRDGTSPMSGAVISAPDRPVLRPQPERSSSRMRLASRSDQRAQELCSLPTASS
jgi:hypothetical protein